MKKIYLWPAQGFGDAICLNALIRNICDEYDLVYLFCSEHFCKSIKWMFRDIKNLNFINLVANVVNIKKRKQNFWIQPKME